MKKLLLLSALLISVLSFGQVPQGISYQAIALNGSGNPVVSSNVRVRLSVLNTTATGAVLYSETQLKTTNAQGLFNLVIGQGTLVSGAFNTINWGVNSKFLKVEMDATGGTTYVLVGTTQLLSVPYALAADSLVTSAGEGITLVSPNGTPYQLTVNDSGQLSLPTSNASTNVPSNLYLYGSFNSWNASTSLQFGSFNSELRGFKYLTAGAQIKFLAAQNENVVYGGNGLSGSLIENGNAITIPSNGFYRINVSSGNYSITSINVNLAPGSLTNYAMSYNVAGDNFYFTYNQGGSSYNYLFKVDTTGDVITYGDNLNDGYVEINGAGIYVSLSGIKLFKFYLNFNGYGNYTIN